MVSKLALDGGPRAVPEGAVKTWPPLTQADRDRVLQVFDNNQLHTNAAPFAQELQTRWAECCGVRHCLVTNGGTGALHMAIAAAGVQAGDEVITSAYSYWATPASILHQNAIPVFVDADPLTGTIDPTQIGDAITENTTAVLPVHIHGMPADLDPIIAIARKHSLAVIGDCCQAHGARYKGKPVGGIEDIAGFSLNRSKNLSGGEGGLVTTDNDDYFRCLEVIFRFQEVPWAREGEGLFAGLGYNYRPHELVNAFVCSQLDRFEEMNGRRREFAAYLNHSLADIPGFAGPHVPAYADPCYWTYMFEVRGRELGLDLPGRQVRDAVLQALAAEGVPTSASQGDPLPAMSIFQHKIGYGKGCPWTCRFGRDVPYRPEDYPGTQTICDTRAYLGGVYPPNDMALMTQYVDAFAKVSENIGRVLELTKA